MMQALSQFGALVRRPAKKAAPPSALERLGDNARSFLGGAGGSTMLWASAGLFATVAFGKATHALGCSPFQVIGLACLCGGVAQLSATFAAMSSEDEQEHICMCGPEEACTGARCPYHADFWPSPEEEQAQEQEEEE